MEGFKISFGHTTGRVIRHAHIIKVNSYLAQTVAVQEIHKVYLNEPYTKCIPTLDHLKLKKYLYEEDYCKLVQFFHASCFEVSTRLTESMDIKLYCFPSADAIPVT